MSIEVCIRPFNEVTSSENSVYFYEKNDQYKQIPDYIHHWAAFIDDIEKEYSSYQKLQSTAPRTPEPDTNLPTDKLITGLSVQHFKSLQNFRIDFANKVNIVLGKNAYGKTSILQALALALIPDDNHDKRDRFEDFIQSGHAGSASLELHRGEDKHAVDILPTRKVSREERYLTEPFVIGYGANIFTRYHEIDYAARCRSMIEGTDRHYHTLSLFADYSDEFADPLRLLYNLQEYLGHEKYKDKKEEIQQIIDLLIETLNTFLGDDYNIVKDDTSFYFKSPSGWMLKTPQLSEGYRTCAVLLMDMFVHLVTMRDRIKAFVGDPELSIREVFRQAKGVVIIDEFDRHLHPSWQKRFVSDLTRVFPQVQFFLATHNPLAVLDRLDGEVQKLVMLENGSLEAQKARPTQQMDVVDVLLEYFEVDSIVSPTLQGKIDAYYKALAAGKSAEEMAHLKKDIDAAHIGITVPDKKYLDYLKFLHQHGIDAGAMSDQGQLTQEQVSELIKLLS
jgi:predicted ATP-binding protein involved in virulence